MWNKLETFNNSPQTAESDLFFSIFYFRISIVKKFLLVFRKIENIRKSYAEQFPNEEDLHMARVGLVRLQSFYKLNHSDIIQGIIKGSTQSTARLDGMI